MLINGEAWRVKMEEDGVELSSNPMQSTFLGASDENINFAVSRAKFSMKKGGDFTLNPTTLIFVKDRYAAKYPVYQSLRQRYRDEYRQLHPDATQNVVFKLQIPRGWSPQSGSYKAYFTPI